MWAPNVPAPQLDWALNLIGVVIIGISLLVMTWYVRSASYLSLVIYLAVCFLTICLSGCLMAKLYKRPGPVLLSVLVFCLLFGIVMIRSRYAASHGAEPEMLIRVSRQRTIAMSALIIFYSIHWLFVLLMAKVISPPLQQY